MKVRNVSFSRNCASVVNEWSLNKFGSQFPSFWKNVLLMRLVQEWHNTLILFSKLSANWHDNILSSVKILIKFRKVWAKRPHLTKNGSPSSFLSEMSICISKIKVMCKFPPKILLNKECCNIYLARAISPYLKFTHDNNLYIRTYFLEENLKPSKANGALSQRTWKPSF